MTVENICEMPGFKPICICDKSREIKGVYAGDLLSWVMTRLSCDFAWVTIMNNVNIVAVSSLCDASVIILTENSEISDEVIESAKEKEVNIIISSMPTYETCITLERLFDGR